MIFSESYVTKWHDTDANRVLRPSAMLTYFEETADRHVRSLGKSLDDMRDENRLGFILSRINMIFHEPVGADEALDVETWTSAGRGFSTERSFRALANGRVVAEGFSTWALVNVDTRRPVKMSEYPLTFHHEKPLALDIPIRVTFPKEIPFAEIGTRKIVYSDIDYNMHMNNTRYPDMLCDFIPDVTEKRVHHVVLSFVHEAAYGRTLTIFRAEANGKYYFRACDGEQICLEAEVSVI